MSDIDALLAKLRNGREGWSGDASCIEAEIGEEAATLITSLREALEGLVGLSEELVDIASDSPDWIQVAYRYGDALIRARTALNPSREQS